jgi:hypothetical protein
VEKVTSGVPVVLEAQLDGTEGKYVGGKWVMYT